MPQHPLRRRCRWVEPRETVSPAAPRPQISFQYFEGGAGSTVNKAPPGLGSKRSMSAPCLRSIYPPCPPSLWCWGTSSWEGFRDTGGTLIPASTSDGVLLFLPYPGSRLPLFLLPGGNTERNLLTEIQRHYVRQVHVCLLHRKIRPAGPILFVVRALTSYLGHHEHVPIASLVRVAPYVGVVNGDHVHTTGPAQHHHRVCEGRVKGTEVVVGGGRGVFVKTRATIVGCFVLASRLYGRFSRLARFRFTRMIVTSCYI